MNRLDEPDYKRFFIALLLAAVTMVVWQAKVEWPRRQILAKMHAEDTRKVRQTDSAHVEALPSKETSAEDSSPLNRSERIAATPRLRIISDKLHGSINLKGARFDDITLAHYRETLDTGSPEVVLFSPSGDMQAYSAQIGWVAQGDVRVPDQQSQWRTDSGTLSAGKTAHLQWDNGQGVVFHLDVALDEHYMFTVKQSVENKTSKPVTVTPYGYINRAYEEHAGQNAILHEGPLGVMDGTLSEIQYKELRDRGSKNFENASGWLGITDKYWLSALIPGEDGYNVTFSYYNKGGKPRYQADYLGAPMAVEPGKTGEDSVRLFAGAKEVKILDFYAKGENGQKPVPLFDRAVDFGSLYFITKPMFLALNFFYMQAGNFGIAIMLLTICVKLLMYPLASKSYKATSQMRLLQPEITRIRERHEGDQMAINKAMMELYKKEKVNPASGCLPILIQMPVFFGLYKVLYVTLEMRQAPFFGWIRDLSAADPSNIFTAFGLIPWNTPEWMHLGVLPLLMCATMVIQMRQQPKPTDPTQAKMIAVMPYFFLFIFAKMPAGLVLYWTWSNLISIIQQKIISTRYNKAHPKPKAQAA